MPKKYAKEDVQGWTDKEVAGWLRSVSPATQQPSLLYIALVVTMA